MNEEQKEKLIAILEEECQKLKNIHNELYKGLVASISVSLQYMENCDYEKAKIILLATIIALESKQKGMEP